jgi:hypothetical protein
VLLDLLDYTFEIGIAGAEDSCEPVATALGDRFAVGDHVELSDLAGLKDGFHAEALFDQGHETRDLGLVVVSRGAVDDFDLHLGLRCPSQCIPTGANADPSLVLGDAQGRLSASPPDGRNADNMLCGVASSGALPATIHATEFFRRL